MDDGCKQRFHENDIRLLLDRNNNTLNIFLNQSERQYLLYKHDKEIIFYGLGGRELARQCPQCRVIFSVSIKYLLKLYNHKKNFN